MPRPCKNRRVNGQFNATYFKPAGIPLRILEEVSIGIDELEAIRLADKEEMYQADAAEKMGVSRQTFGNIIKAAHKKIAEALITGKALKVEGVAPISYVEDLLELPGQCQRPGRLGRGNCGRSRNG